MEADEDYVREAIVNMEDTSKLLGGDQKEEFQGCKMDMIGLPKSLRKTREQLEPNSPRENENQPPANLKSWLVKITESMREAELYESLSDSKRRRHGARSSSSPSEKMSSQSFEALCNGMLSQKGKDKLKAMPGFLAHTIVSRMTMKINQRVYERTPYAGGVAQDMDSLVTGLCLLAHAICENRTQEGPGLGVTGPIYQLMIRWDGQAQTKGSQGQHGNAQDGRYGNGNNWGGGGWKNKKWGNQKTGGGYAANQGGGGHYGGNSLAGGSQPSGTQNQNPNPPAHSKAHKEGKITITKERGRVKEKVKGGTSFSRRN